MRFLYPLLVACLLGILATPSIARASYGVCETKPLEVTEVPAEKNPDGRFSFYQTELCPPAAGEQERFFLVWAGAECDSQLNFAIVKVTPRYISSLWLVPAGGTPGYFNLIDLDRWAFTLVDYHAGKYHSYVIDARKPKMEVEFNQSVDIPLPSRYQHD